MVLTNGMALLTGWAALLKKGLTVLLLFVQYICQYSVLHFPAWQKTNIISPVIFPEQNYKKAILLFFNTLGGVSHVGIYLRNNKFVHASIVKGVTISDMFEPYYLQRFIGAGRIKNKPESVVLR